MTRWLIAAAAAIVILGALFWPQGARAQDCSNPAALEAMLKEQGMEYTYLEPQFVAPFVRKAEAVFGITVFVQVTGILLAGERFGFVSGQCVSNPLPIGPMLPAKVRLSGYVDGRYYA